MPISKRHGYRGPVKNLGNYSPTELAQWQKILSSLPSYNQLSVAAVTAVDSQSITVLPASGSPIHINWSGLQWAAPALSHGAVGTSPTKASDIVQQGDVVYIQKAADQQWQLSQIPQVQGSLVSVSPVDGRILALVGGYDYSLSKFNRVTQAVRQPGSSFKPFIYSAALAKGFTMASIINDAPIVFAG